MRQKITPSPAPDKLLRVRAAAEMLGVSKSTIWRYVRCGKLTAVKLSEMVTGFKLPQIQALIAGAAK